MALTHGIPGLTKHQRIVLAGYRQDPRQYLQRKKKKKNQTTLWESNECIQMWVCFNQIFETLMLTCFVEHFQALLGLLSLGQT